jgi:hypothetical protein
LGNSGVVERLAASQEGSSSIELVKQTSFIFKYVGFRNTELDERMHAFCAKNAEELSVKLSPNTSTVPIAFTDSVKVFISDKEEL